MTMSVRETTPAARATPSTMMCTPVGDFAIWRMMPTVPIWLQVGRLGIVRVLALERQEQHPVRAERAVDRLDRHRPVGRERLERQREQDALAEREHRQFGRQLD